MNMCVCECVCVGVCVPKREREHLAGTLGGGDGALLQLETRERDRESVCASCVCVRECVCDTWRAR